jgi:hypothetical protein
MFLLLVLTQATGCLLLPEKQDLKPATKATTLQHGPVTPEQVREGNAHAIADALEVEVKTDETTSPRPETEEPKPTAKK